ncbi:MAG TPA: right-handed parallel beta-helix repeat-containing protein [Tepidisphaeraceae bacterium]|nr:right-handed parallel beta-helix repeat-containing protein [Tepidisphaeraceae bacterium]
MKNLRSAIVASFVLLAFSISAFAQNASTPVGDPVLEPPTLRCLGVYWVIRGDDNQNAHVEFDYRKSGTTDWRSGPPLFRVERRSKPYLDEGGQPKPPSQVKIPADGWLFAGSLLLLDPDTAYDLRLKLIDPDGGSLEKLLQAHTIAEPKAPADAPQRHVIPGDGGGSGTVADPFKGLNAAQKAARPGDIFLLHAGTYNGSFVVDRSGEIGKPIIWRGAGDGQAILDGQRPIEKLSGSTIEAVGVHDVWFENLSVCNAYNLIKAHESSRIVVRRCHLYRAYCGVVATENKTGNLRDFFISDNVFEGMMPWPVTEQQWHDLPECRAVWLTGSGHVVCYNRIHHWKDGMDTDDGPVCCAIDFHNNDISEMFDDGSEMDGSERNTRNFCNRYCNTLTGVSLQPVYGGPIYVYRNVIFNCLTEGFKLHNSPSGALLIHNTVVKNGTLLELSTEDEVIHCISRNNLFLGTSGRAMDYEPKMIDCDFDHDGFGGFSGPVFIKWNGERYATVNEVRAKSPIEKHCVIVDPATAFLSGVVPPAKPRTIVDNTKVDVRLKAGSGAIDAGEVLPGFNNGFKGKAPDLGAYEFGDELMQYGPRAVK